MNKNHPILRGRILFQRDQETERFVLRWTRLGVNDAIKSWGPPSTDFPSAVEAIAYGKNLAPKHLTEKGLAEAVEKKWNGGSKAMTRTTALAASLRWSMRRKRDDRKTFLT